MLIKLIYMEFSRFAEYFKGLSLLFVRLILAYGFFEPAMMKWSDISAVSRWFESMGIPFPTLNAYLASMTELSGVILLTLGFLTRLIALPLIIVMIVAIITVHLPQGFAASNNGFEIPLYYMIMLFVLIAHGPGQLSVDKVVFEER